MAGRSLQIGAIMAAAMVGTVVQPQMAPPPRTGTYDAAFFEQHRQHEGVYKVLVEVFSGLILQDELLDLDEISVLDVGCGHGLLVEEWRRAGVVKSFCVEGSPEAAVMWPQRFQAEFYKVQDLEAVDAGRNIEETDFATSFEVAEHLKPSAAHHFVGLLTMHRPKLVFFSAATPFQDRGNNPTHFNENTFEYWIEHFAKHKYRVNWAKTAFARIQLVSRKSVQEMREVQKAWWYPKNLLIFSPAERRAEMDAELRAVPQHVDMLSESFLGMAGDDEFGKMWRRDWQFFGRLFKAAQDAARKTKASKDPRAQEL